MPAEWEPHARAWMCWPCRPEAFGGADGLLRAKQSFARVARAISTFEPVVMAVRPEEKAEVELACAGKVETFSVPLDDSWARDSGPTFLSGVSGAKGGVAWRFNAWGNKYHPYTEDAAFGARVLSFAGAKTWQAPLVCEGGAIHVDGAGTLMTTEQCLLNDNRNPSLTRQEVEERLALYTGARRIVWLGDGFADEETDGHIDNIACFAGEGRVIVGIPPREHPDWAPVAEAILRIREAQTAEGGPFEIIELPQPRRLRQDWRGLPLAASYVNFYLPNGGLIMPAFNDANDEKARAILADCFPGRDVLQIEALDIVEGGGGIHCITQQEPA